MSWSPVTGLLCVRGQHTPNDLYSSNRPHQVGTRYDGGFTPAQPAEGFATTTAIGQFQTASWARATPMTYRPGGRQFIALATPQGLLTFALPQ